MGMHIYAGILGIVTGSYFFSPLWGRSGKFGNWLQNVVDLASGLPWIVMQLAGSIIVGLLAITIGLRYEIDFLITYGIAAITTRLWYRWWNR